MKNQERWQSFAHTVAMPAIEAGLKQRVLKLISDSDVFLDDSIIFPLLNL